MKNLLLIIALLFSTLYTFSQNVTGKWNGSLSFQGVELRLVFDVSETDGGYSSKMDSPDQGAKDIPVTKTIFENGKITFEITSARIKYSGELKGEEIVGIFKQGGMEFPMTLTRKEITKTIVHRPQEPKKPYPYYTEDVTFVNKKAKITLAGTLTLPSKEGKFPVVVMITGSGQQNRDEELLGHKPFLVIADHLTKNGIGVLRCDDRGIGKSTGDFSKSNTADFVTDIQSAVAYLKTRKEVDKKKIGLIGHSEGGVIAPMVAAKTKEVSYIVLLAGTGISGDEILLLQQALIAKADGQSEEEIKDAQRVNKQLFELINKNESQEQLEKEIAKLIDESMSNDTMELPEGMTKEEYTFLLVKDLSSPWMKYFIKLDPKIALAKVKCPVLAMNGEKDLQVPPKENLTAIKETLNNTGNLNVTIIEFPNLNHLFQECVTGSPSEYSTIEQTISPLVLDKLTEWILLQTK